MTKNKRNRFAGRSSGAAAATAATAPAREQSADTDTAEFAAGTLLHNAISKAALDASAGVAEICANIAENTVVVEETEEANAAAARTRSAIVERIRALAAESSKAETEKFAEALGTAFAEHQSAGDETDAAEVVDDEPPAAGEIGEIGEHGESGDRGTNAVK